MKNKVSKLQKNPRSKVLIPGYINIYSELNKKEKRQHFFKTRYKKFNPDWDETLVFLSNELKNRVRKNCVVLDVGCGNGNYVIDENRGDISWAVGIDTGKELVKKNICLDEIIIASIYDLPFDDSTFDVVISLWVLEHLKNPSKAFEEIHRVLKKGGIFMFATPNSYFSPVLIMNLVKSSKINSFLNEKLFGRAEADVFEAFYKANSVGKIKSLASGLFEVEILKLNYDPSYTSFNAATFLISNMVSQLQLSITMSHLIGVFMKRH